MNINKILLIIIIVLALLLVASIAYVFLFLQNNESNSCSSLGCPSSSVFVGSVNSDKYYSCSCSYAKRIKPENVICFSSDSDALSHNYTKTDC